MKAKLHIQGSSGDIELMKSYVALTSKLPIESEELKDDGSLIWILKTFGEKERDLIKQLSRKTTSLQYRLSMLNDNKK